MNILLIPGDMLILVRLYFKSIDFNLLFELIRKTYPNPKFVLLSVYFLGCQWEKPPWDSRFKFMSSNVHSSYIYIHIGGIITTSKTELHHSPSPPTYWAWLGFLILHPQWNTNSDILFYVTLPQHLWGYIWTYKGSQQIPCMERIKSRCLDSFVTSMVMNWNLRSESMTCYL